MKEKRSKMVGKRELLHRFPTIEQSLYEQAEQLFPIRITRSWLLRENSPVGPLVKQALPDGAELEKYKEDHLDPVGEESLSPHPWLIQKYSNRILFITTRRCHLYCRYCFRRNHTGAEDPTREELESAIAYINQKNIQECILSGGDPLAISSSRLSLLLSSISSPVIRIHTRAPITEPSVVRSSLLDILKKRSGLWMIVHCNHPKELSPEVIAGLRAIQECGIPLLNQAVLLKGVNDSVDVLEELCNRLVSLQIFPYYLHHTDAAQGNAHFRVSLNKGISIYQELRKRVSGIALPRYVIDPPTGEGKIDVERFIQQNPWAFKSEKEQNML